METNDSTEPGWALDRRHSEPHKLPKRWVMLTWGGLLLAWIAFVALN